MEGGGLLTGHLQIMQVCNCSEEELVDRKNVAPMIEVDFQDIQ